MQNDTMPGYLRGEDLQRDGKWAEFTLEVAEVLEPGTVRAADKTLIDKPIIAFVGAEKRFVLGTTNQRLIACQLGNKPTQWVGRKLTLYPATGNWFGVKDAITIRVRIPEGVPRPFIAAKNIGTDITGKPVKGIEV